MNGYTDAPNLILTITVVCADKFEWDEIETINHT